MKRVLIICCLLLLVGCGVSQDDYDKLETKYDELKAENDTLKQENKELQDRIEELQNSSYEETQTEDATPAKSIIVFDKTYKCPYNDDTITVEYTPHSDITDVTVYYFPAEEDDEQWYNAKIHDCTWFVMAELMRLKSTYCYNVAALYNHTYMCDTKTGYVLAKNLDGTFAEGLPDWLANRPEYTSDMRTKYAKWLSTLQDEIRADFEAEGIK